MNYHNITYPDMNNGDGLRAVLWLSGCSHHCYNCQNPQTWDYNSGIFFDEFAKKELFAELEKNYISGLTLSGGDPLYEKNLNEVLDLIIEIKNLYQKNIWIYSGYTWNQIMFPIVTGELNFQRDEIINKRKKIVSLCDVLVDGKYIESQRDTSLKWRGSKNQRVIDVKKTLQQGKIVLHCD